MRRRHGRLRKKEIKKQRRIIALSLIGVTFLFASGYAAFSTNLGINAKGNLVNYSRTLATTYITNLYSNGDTTLIDDETDDHNIRYSGKPVNNYVCLENEKQCNDDNLYRIIGVFNNIKTTENGIGETRIKLIKATSIGEMMWNQVNDNTWNTSTLANYLNNDYLNSFTTSKRKLLGNTIWNISSLNFGNNTYSYYTKERLNSNISTNIWNGIVGLYSPSDFGFATGITNRERCLNASLYNFPVGEYEEVYKDIDGCLNNNWLYNRNETWFINPGNNDTRVMFLYPEGYIDYGGKHGTPNVNLNVYPTFFLKSTVKIINNGNNGSEQKPYILESGD